MTVILSSMQYNPLMENVESFSINSSKELSYEVLENNDPVENKTVTNNNIQVENQEITNNSIWKKIKELDTIFRLNMDQKNRHVFGVLVNTIIQPFTYQAFM